MNKKNLSVVLAGAMLATSVAPVLADTTATTEKEYSLDNIKLLQNELISSMKKEMLTTNSVLLNDTAEKYISSDVKSKLGSDKSAFSVKVLNKSDKEIASTNVATDAAVSAVLAEAKEGYKVQLVRDFTTTFFGELIPGSEILKKESTESEYTKADFKVKDTDHIFDATTTIGTQLGLGKNKYVSSIVGTGKFYKTSDDSELSKLEDGAYYKKVNVITNKLIDKAGSTSEVSNKELLPLSIGDKKIDANLPLDANGKLLDCTVSTDVQSFKKFETLSDWTISQAVDKASEVKEIYKMTAATVNDENTIKASDLYDGVALTAKGTELLNELKFAAENVGEEISTSDYALVKLEKNAKFDTPASVYKFTIKYYKKDSDAHSSTNEYKTVTVYSSNAREIKSLYTTLQGGTFAVGIVGGANRYATAVNVAKEQKANIGTAKNVVLVNGNSLVDGLSAAPLAASLSASAGQVPVLLTKADTLPSETREYIELATKDLTPYQKKGITINLVGGESVLTSSLVEELENMGFYVKRFGGDNRETTSLTVAKEIAKKSDKTNPAFVVGGNGEADAMAISAVAAKTKTPIIVSSVHGLSSDALEYLEEKSSKGDVTVVGGESVVSSDELESINDSLTLNKASRIAGENRFETNAAIIKEYYGANKVIATSGVENVILAKDGQANKGELVDALAAANLAAKNEAPIVLATNSLNAAQKNELLKVKKAKAAQLVQVGNGVERSVLEAVAGLFGLSNK